MKEAIRISQMGTEQTTAEQTTAEQMTAEQVRDMFLAVADTIVRNEPCLTEIDRKIGDGDHGTGMEMGFRAAGTMLAAGEYAAVEAVFKELGTILLDTMGGASGVLFGTLFISGIIRREPSAVFRLSDFAECFRISSDAIRQRGKARTGDKTMVDALEPAVLALEAAVMEKLDLRDGFRRAAKAAKDGAEDTKQMKARFGRAKYYGEKAIGLQDAGATSVWLIFQAMSDWISSELI